MLNKQDVLSAIKAAKENSKKRNFVQSLDLAVNFKGIDFKKDENKIDTEVNLPHATQQTAKKKLVFVQDKNFAAQLKGKADRVVMADEIPAIKKKQLDELLNEYSILLAEGPAMLVVGKYLGQLLAPKGRMPRPIQPTIDSYEAALSMYGSSIRLSNKKGKSMPVIHIKLGDENTKEENVAENIIAIHDALSAKLPQKEHSIKSIYVKLTMGAPVKIGAKITEAAKEKKPEAFSAQKALGKTANAKSLSAFAKNPAEKMQKTEAPRPKETAIEESE